MSAVRPVQLPTIEARGGQTIEVARLTRRYAAQHADELLRLHNLIPYVKWAESDLLAAESDEGAPFQGRWQLSLVARARRQPIGLLVAYLREADARHPMESAYIHRLAVDAEWQRQGIGSGLIRTAATWYFSALPWLLSITSQTNDEIANRGVLEFYSRLGFRRTYPVRYPNKRDILLEIERATWPGTPPPATSSRYPPIDIRQTAFASRPPAPAPLVYFGTSSQEKLIQYQHLMRCYGLRVRRLRPIVSLVEPQVEGHDERSEEALVAEPLKWFSRFAARAGSYPVVIEDTMLLIEHFNAAWSDRPILPGADTKRWWQALGVEGLLKLMSGSRRRRARYVCQLGVNTGPGEYRSFRTELEGRIALSAKTRPSVSDAFPLTNPTFFHQIFVPTGERRTLAELEPDEFAAFDYRRACVQRAAPHLHQSAARSRQAELFTDSG